MWGKERPWMARNLSHRDLEKFPAVISSRAIFHHVSVRSLGGLWDKPSSSVTRIDSALRMRSEPPLHGSGFYREQSAQTLAHNTRPPPPSLSPNKQTEKTFLVSYLVSILQIKRTRLGSSLNLQSACNIFASMHAFFKRASVHFI